MMSELDLRRELHHAQRREIEVMHVLEAAGVSVSAFMVSGWPGVARVKVVERLYHPHPMGRDMVILPAWLGAGPLYDNPVLADLLAFDAARPARWFNRIGESGLVLGAEFVGHALNSGEPIRLCPTPLAWLQAGCLGGAVMLDDAEVRQERTRAWRVAA